MSALRILGVVGGLLIFLFAFLQFRAGRSRRVDFIVGSLTGSLLIIVAANPSTVNLLRDLLALESEQFSRIIALLIAAVVVMWMLLLQSQGRITALSDQFDKLVRATAATGLVSRNRRDSPSAEILVAIPAYNEAENIGTVIQRVPRSVLGSSVEVLVVDDGSSDDTFQRAVECGAFAVRSPINRGGGAALRIGFDIARSSGARIVVTMDADGQHLPEEIENLVAPLLRDEADIVIGSRILGRRDKDSAIRYAGILVFNLVIRTLSSARVTDCSSGFRAITTRCLGELLLRQDQYHTSELIIDASRRGLRISEAPITVKRRLSGTSKKGRNLTYGLSFARTIFRTWWR